MEKTVDRAVKKAKLTIEELAAELGPIDKWSYYNQLAEWTGCEQDMALMTDRPEAWGEEPEED